MKTLSIALLSLKRSFRSAFALAFMFAIPLVVTGMFYLMFGSTPTPASANSPVPALPAASAWVELRAPLALRVPLGGTTPPPAPVSPLAQIVAPIMGGMMIFFAFFTGASTCSSILKEDEEGTLPRLFSTPTALGSILGGKFAAVGLTVLIQVVVLLAAARLIFAIQWGALPSVAMAALGIVTCATAFGIFLTSLLKNARQGGVVYGGLMTITGMVGMLGIFSASQLSNTVSLVMPQGWAVRGLMLAMHGATSGEAALNLLVLLGWSLVFFTAGLLRFQKRFA